ncbi:MAG: 50S ribosomal protein L2, partial [Candidatus Omnitrophica bacterium]|nr:50S ribosomal protein L2 [Candidatus Omnitrophota bacterium]
MGVKTHKPTTPTLRFQITSDFKEITKKRPVKRLLEPMRKTGGRNAHGRITSRFMGGGHKQQYRRIDFYRRDKIGVPAKVLGIEYDPNRSSRISLLEYADGELRYILWPEGLNVGETVLAGEEAEIKIGNAMPLR